MTNIIPEKNDPSKGKKNVEYFYKAECSNVIINDENHTVKLTIIKRLSEDHRFYSLYIAGLYI